MGGISSRYTRYNTQRGQRLQLTPVFVLVYPRVDDLGLTVVLVVLRCRDPALCSL